MTSIDDGKITWTRAAAMKYNGVDIAKDRKTKRVINFAKQNKHKSLANYLTKYVTKNEGRFQHLAWHNSRGYSNLITQLRLTYDEYLKWGFNLMIDTTTKLEGEYFYFYRWKAAPPPILTTYLSQLNNAINHILN
jgi:hypothetical protein